MLILTETDEIKNLEKNKKKDLLFQEICREVEKTLERDEYDLFEIKRSQQIDQVINVSDRKIKELLTEINRLRNESSGNDSKLDSQIQNNSKKIQLLMGKLK